MLCIIVIVVVIIIILKLASKETLSSKLSETQVTWQSISWHTEHTTLPKAQEVYQKNEIMITGYLYMQQFSYAFD